MNPILIDYILRWLAPSEYKLELKNRLENLCSLSGTPMSPGLHQWVTKKFGLEMTRVIEDYSTFTSPKLSPELLSVVDRIVPTNYQGYDANLGFRQLFDVGCVQQPCIYFGNYRYGDDAYDSTSVLPVNSTSPLILIQYVGTNAHLNGYTDFGFIPGLFYDGYFYDGVATLWTLATSEPVGWQGYNSINMDYEDIIWKPATICDLSTSCWQATGTFDSNVSTEVYSIYININLLGIFGYSYTDITSTDYKSYLTGIFGGQSSVDTNVDPVNGTWTITIYNAYTQFAPYQVEVLANFNNQLQNFYQITCP